MQGVVATKQGVLDAIGNPSLCLIKEGSNVWVLMLMVRPMRRRSVRIRRVSDRPLDWWVARGRELIDGDTSDVDAMSYDP